MFCSIMLARMYITCILTAVLCVCLPVVLCHLEMLITEKEKQLRQTSGHSSYITVQ